MAAAVGRPEELTPLSSQRSAPFPAACNTWDKRQWGPPDQSKTSFGKGVLIGVDKKMSSSNKIEIFSGQQDQISFLSSWKYLDLIRWTHHFINKVQFYKSSTKVGCINF